MKKTFILLAFSLTLSAGVSLADDDKVEAYGVSYERNGNTVSGNNGVNYEVSGNMVSSSRGERYEVIGNQVYKDGKPVCFISDGQAFCNE